MSSFSLASQAAWRGYVYPSLAEVAEGRRCQLTEASVLMCIWWLYAHNILYVYCSTFNFQVWGWLAVLLEDMHVPRRKSPSHALLEGMLFSGEMENLERSQCTLEVHLPGGTFKQLLSAITEARIAWFPLWVFVQLPHAMEPQSTAQIGNKV